MKILLRPSKLLLEMKGYDFIDRVDSEGEKSVDDKFGYVMVVLKNGSFFAQKGYNIENFLSEIRKIKDNWYNSIYDLEKDIIDLGLKKIR